MQRETGLLKTSLLGAALAALCCAAPLLVATLGAVGLGVLLSVLGVGVLAALFGLLAVAGYVLWWRRGERRCATGIKVHGDNMTAETNRPNRPLLRRIL